jgi:hypothetical protein
MLAASKRKSDLMRTPEHFRSDSQTKPKKVMSAKYLPSYRAALARVSARCVNFTVADSQANVRSFVATVSRSCALSPMTHLRELRAIARRSCRCAQVMYARAQVPSHPDEILLIDVQA